MKPKTPWFDRDCIIAKRKLNVLARLYGMDPTNQHSRDTYYDHRRAYRRNFCEFFKALYGKPTLDERRIDQLRNDMDKMVLHKELAEILDQDISMGELRSCISASKKNKAVAEDLITDEFLKSSGAHMLNAILNVFNHCLSIGAYP
ncbi:hypothetical protein ACHWQZ_G000003 [Mnemiopsis leidyi]